jgi:hypothetical protein
VLALRMKTCSHHWSLITSLPLLAFSHPEIKENRMADPFVGEIRLFAGTYAPQGWLACDGSQVLISENEILFTLLGTTYGGDGVRTFALPDLRNRLPVGTGKWTRSDATRYGADIRGGKCVTDTSATPCA